MTDLILIWSSPGGVLTSFKGHWKEMWKLLESGGTAVWGISAKGLLLTLTVSASLAQRSWSSLDVAVSVHWHWHWHWSLNVIYRGLILAGVARQRPLAATRRLIIESAWAEHVLLHMYFMVTLLFNGDDDWSICPRLPLLLVWPLSGHDPMIHDKYAAERLCSFQVFNVDLLPNYIHMFACSKH